MSEPEWAAIIEECHVALTKALTERDEWIAVSERAAVENHRLCGERDEAVAEVTRLRAALKDIRRSLALNSDARSNVLMQIADAALAAAPPGRP